MATVKRNKNNNSTNSISGEKVFGGLATSNYNYPNLSVRLSYISLITDSGKVLTYNESLEVIRKYVLQNLQNQKENIITNFTTLISGGTTFIPKQIILASNENILQALRLYELNMLTYSLCYVPKAFRLQGGEDRYILTTKSEEYFYNPELYAGFRAGSVCLVANGNDKKSWGAQYPSSNNINPPILGYSDKSLVAAIKGLKESLNIEIDINNYCITMLGQTIVQFSIREDVKISDLKIDNDPTSLLKEIYGGESNAPVENTQPPQEQG